jgi:hypothetical protein
MDVFHSYNVQTVYRHEHTGIFMYFVCIHVQTMYIPCTYMAYTISLCNKQEIQKENYCKGSASNPQSCAQQSAALTTMLPACLYGRQ